MHADPLPHSLLRRPLPQVALDRHAAGACLLLPVHIGALDYSTDAYPEAGHFLSGRDVRATVAAMLKLQVGRHDPKGS